jgi:hypothetical protein
MGTRDLDWESNRNSVVGLGMDGAPALPDCLDLAGTRNDVGKRGGSFSHEAPGSGRRDWRSPEAGRTWSHYWGPDGPRAGGLRAAGHLDPSIGPWTGRLDPRRAIRRGYTACSVSG